MSMENRVRSAGPDPVNPDPVSPDPASTDQPLDAASEDVSSAASVVVRDEWSARTPRTRTGMAWFGLCAATVMFVFLIVFMAQNTRSTEVSFLWLHGTVPLALALLVAGVGSALLTMVVGAARIVQLRRLWRRQR